MRIGGPGVAYVLCISALTDENSDASKEITRPRLCDIILDWSPIHVSSQPVHRLQSCAPAQAAAPNSPPPVEVERTFPSLGFSRYACYDSGSGRAHYTRSGHAASSHAASCSYTVFSGPEDIPGSRQAQIKAPEELADRVAGAGGRCDRGLVLRRVRCDHSSVSHPSRIHVPQGISHRSGLSRLRHS
jgi:hypothetical protein